jgi:4-amino-4-deoxy-L-arabinose transferase-like glycosyltransferase
MTRKLNNDNAFQIQVNEHQAETVGIFYCPDCWFQRFSIYNIRMFIIKRFRLLTGMNILSFRNRNTPAILFVFIMIIAAYVAGLFVDVTRDASKYAAIAREIFETGDFINIKVNGEPYLQKPPLLFWLSALSFMVFGISNFAFKLPILLFTFLGLYSVYRLGKSIYNRNAGIIAAVILGSSQISFLYNMDIHTDTLMQSCVTFSVWQLYEFLKTRRSAHCYLGFLGIGLAMLSKGLVGAVVPAFAVAGYLIFNGQLSRLKDYRWYLALLIPLVCILPALAGLFNQFGWEGIRFFFWTNNAGRLAGEYTASSRSLFFYVYNLVVFFFPWTLLLLVSLFFEFRLLFLRKFKARDWFLFSNIWFFFVIISFSRGKLPNYVYVLIPFFSLITAKYIVIATSGMHHSLLRLLLKLQNVAYLLLFVVIAILVFWLYPLSLWWQWALLAVMILLSVVFCFDNFHPVLKLLLPSLTLTIVLNFFINQHATPQIFADQASVKAAQIFNRLAAKNDQLYNYNYFSHELYFYSHKGASNLRNDLALFELMKKPGNWVFTTREVVERMPDDQFPKPEIIPLSHVWINRLSVKYLIPATRASARDTLFLLRSAALPLSQ